MDMQLENRKVFVTASSAGIGKAIAEVFLQEGALVCINGRNKQKLICLELGLQEQYGKERVLSVSGDMSEEAAIINACQYIQRQWGKIDILIGNLGTGKPVTEKKLDIVEWQHMMDKNLFSCVRLLENAETILQNDGGSIVLISSLGAYDRIEAPPAYAAAKKGILSLIKYMSVIYAQRGIRINGVAPGNVFYEGGRWEELLHRDKDSVRNYIEQEVPIKRFGKTKEIADAVVFLASERSSFTTGSILNVDGGQRRGY